MLSRLVIAFLPRTKTLLISWLQSPPVILELKKIKSVTVSTHLFAMKWCGRVPGYSFFECEFKPAFSCSSFTLISSVQLLSHFRLLVTPWTTAHQVSLSTTDSRSPSKPMSIESVMPSNHLILCHPLLLLSSIIPSFRVFSSESALCMRWLKYWSFSFNLSPYNEHQDWSPLGWTGWISLQSKGLSRVFSNTAVQKHQFFGAQLSS